MPRKRKLIEQHCSTDLKTVADPVNPTEVPSSSQLWASSDTAVWEAVQKRYDDAVAAKSSKGKAAESFSSLDSWYRTALPAGLRASEVNEPEALGRHIARAQLETLVAWKLARGKWRPRLLAYARKQPEGAVEEASMRALAALRNYSPPSWGGSELHPGIISEGPDLQLRYSVEALTALKGVGPATASALLAADCPHVPYMGDEALSACLSAGRPLDYSLNAFLELASQLQRKAKLLNEHTNGEVTYWTASELERCLWVAGVLSEH